jgi:hypothetical protein
MIKIWYLLTINLLLLLVCSNYISDEFSEDYAYYVMIFYSCYVSFTFYVLTKYHYVRKVFKSESQFTVLFLIVVFLNVGLTYDLLSENSKLRYVLSETDNYLFETNKYVDVLKSRNAELTRILKPNHD